MTLTALTLGRMTWAKRIALVVAGTALIAIAAQVRVPFYPVPMTLQTLAVLAIGLAYGPRLGMATVGAYLAQGAAGLPVFTGAMNGAAFVGPTAGFLVGFVAMAGIAGIAAGRGVAAMAAAAVAGSVILYLFGLAWPFAVAGLLGVEAGWASMEPGALLRAFMTPFLLGDAVKAAIAVTLVAGASGAMRSLRG